MLKEKFKKVVGIIKENPKTVGFATAIAVPIATFAEGSSGHLINTSGVNFMSVLDEMVALVPVVLPVIVGCIAFRKGIDFIKGAIYGA